MAGTRGNCGHRFEMKLVTTNLGTILTRLACVDRHASDSIDIDGMIAHISANDDSEHRALCRINHQDPPHRPSSIIGAVASRDNVLHADFVSSRLAHSLQSNTGKTMRRAPGVAIRVLNVAHLVRDEERKLSAVIAQDLKKSGIQIDHVSGNIRLSIDHGGCNHLQTKVRHRICLHATFCRTKFQAMKHFLHRCIRTNALLRSGHWMTGAVGGVKTENYQCQQSYFSNRITRIISSSWLVIRIRDGYAAAWHGARIFLGLYCFVNGTIVPRMGSENG